jgi:acetate kinase
MAAEYLGKPLDKTNLITAHLGNGASITAIRNGKSVDTSMGFSPLPGLVMGTRSGDIDPAVIFYMANGLGMSTDKIDTVLNKKSGLLGLAGSSDLRDILKKNEEGNPDAALALSLYTYRIKKYIGAYLAVLGRVDALVFTAGVGENSPYIRWHACEGLTHLGISLDQEKNEAKIRGITEIHKAESPVNVLVIPTNEELEIALQTEALIKTAKTL